MNDSFFLSILSGYDTLFKILLTLIILDYISGVLKAIYMKKLNSSIGAKGIIKKIGYIILVILVQVLGLLLNDDGYVRSIVPYMFIANEGLSILENWSKMGIQMPKFIKDKFDDWKGGEKNE